MAVGCVGSLVLALNKLSCDTESRIVMAAQSSAWSRCVTAFWVSELFIQLAFSHELGCGTWATWFKASLYLPAEINKLYIAWGLVLRCEVWSSGWTLTHSRHLALHCPVHCTFRMNFFVFLCHLSHLNAEDFTLKTTQYEAQEEIAQMCGPRCHEYADCISWFVFPVLYLCFTLKFQKTLLHFIICSLKEDCESLYSSPCTCDYSQK